jgi:hypothetical protein
VPLKRTGEDRVFGCSGQAVGENLIGMAKELNRPRSVALLKHQESRFSQR